MVGKESPTSTDSTIDIQALFSPPKYESLSSSGYPLSSHEQDLEFREPTSADNRKVARVVNAMGKETLRDLGTFYETSSDEGTVAKDIPEEEYIRRMQARDRGESRGFKGSIPSEAFNSFLSPELDSDGDIRVNLQPKLLKGTGN